MLTGRTDPEAEAPILWPSHETENEMIDSVIEATNMNLTKPREAVEDRRAWHALVHGVTKSRTRLND